MISCPECGNPTTRVLCYNCTNKGLDVMGKLLTKQVKIELKITDVDTGKEIVLDETFDFFHMVQTVGIQNVPNTRPPIKEPDGRSKTTIVLGNGIKHQDEEL